MDISQKIKFSHVFGILLLSTVLVGLSVLWSIASAGPGNPPVANDDTAILNQDAGPIVVNWISNDELNDNATLDSFDTISANGGTVTDNGDGTFNYTPSASFNGGDGFTYTICDDDTPTAECDTASVSITVVAVSACLTGFYQTISGEINLLDTTVNPATYVSAAADIGELNATGFNPNDGLIYGFSSNLDEVVSFDPKTGIFTNVFTHIEDAPFAGDVDSSNNLWYNTSGSTTLWQYNTSTDTRSSITLNTSHGVADFAYVPSTSLFYGIRSGGTNMAIINTGTATVTTLALSGPITSQTGGFGATWVTDSMNLYAFNNNSGDIFNINIATGVSTYVATSAPNGSNDGMSCAAGTDPFNISAILDYGDAPDTYSTLLASTGASAVVNTSYRLGNYNEIDADGQPSAGADADDLDELGDDEDGARLGIESLQGNRLYEEESNTLTIDVPLNNGFVSVWVDYNDDGDFDAGEQVLTDASPSGGVATATFTPSFTSITPFDTYVRVRLAARTGASATDLFSFGEVEDYYITMYPSRPTITNGVLPNIPNGGGNPYTISGVCTDDGDSVTVSITDGSSTINVTPTTCSSSMFSVDVDLTSLNDGTLTVTSVIDDSINPTATDIDTLEKDTVVPTIDQDNAVDISQANASTYPVSGSCSNDGDAITVALTDSDSPANTVMTSLSCSSGMYSTTLNASGLIEGSVTVESVIDDGINPQVMDSEVVTKDILLPTIDLTGPLPAVNADNATNYPLSGTCSEIGDSITVQILAGAVSTSAVTTCIDDGFGSGEFSSSLDVSLVDPGTYDIKATISDGVNADVSDVEQTSMPEDLDDDDTSSTEEKAGPNDGDGNNDGIKDHIQDSVTTKVNPVISAYVTTEVSGGCTELDAVSFHIEPELAEQDEQYQYDLGLHGFEVSCSGVGQTVHVTHYWDQVYDTTSWTYRKFISSENAYIDFNDQVTYGVENIGGKDVTTVSFQLTDGGPYDSDGVANGRIVDPAGPGVNISLADTGSGSVPVVLVGAILATITLMVGYLAKANLPKEQQ